MDYSRVYRGIISKVRSQDETKTGYWETHHIIPRSEGGLDTPENLVKLTAREHFLAHWLLYRIDSTLKSRAHSFWRMCNGGKIMSSRAYQEAREAHSKAISQTLKGRKKSPEHIAKVALANTGKKRTPETKKLMSLLKKGKPLSQSHIGNMKGRVPWNKGKEASQEARKKLSNSLKGNNNAGKCCVINGTPYKSIKEGAEQEGLTLSSVKYRMRTNKEGYCRHV